MNRRRILLVVFPVVLLAAAGATFPPAAINSVPDKALPSIEHAPLPSVSEWARADTRVDTVKAGQVYITQLPDSLEGRAISSYTADRLPLKSWLLDRSFFWSTSGDDRGSHAFDLETHVLDEAEEESVIFTLRLVVL